MGEPLPIDDHVPEILAAVKRARAVVVVAAPGAGKTTRVPPALTADGAVLLLQPRRVAARAIARRIAEEQHWTLGREVGWHVRFDRRFSDDTWLIVATEGILTARLQQDPKIRGFRTVILDEFHERSIHADVGLTLARQAWMARDDLRLVVMSATIDAARVAAFLGGCPVIHVPGRTYPLEIVYRPGVALEQAVTEVLPRLTGAALCFLPGAPEIRRAADRLTSPLAAAGVAVRQLHGGLDADEQDAAIQAGPARRIVLATNIAETTLTVPDVTMVVDTGLLKVARYDAARAIDSLEMGRVSEDSADQRAGRAGRTGPGLAVRLWDARDRLRPHREPEIARIDLASTILDILAWGGDPGTLEWFEAPPRHAIDAGLELLRRLGAVASGRVTDLGRRLQQLPLHPRLGRILLEARGADVAARACALLSERHFVPPRHGATACDVLSAVDQQAALPPDVLQTARHIRAAAESVLGADSRASIDETAFRRAMLAGYPDRVAKRRAPRTDRLLLSSGTGARLARESGVHNAEYLVAVEVAGGSPATGGDAVVRLATGIEREWIVSTGRETRHVLDAATGTVRALGVEKYDAIVIGEFPGEFDQAEAARLLAVEYIRRGPTPADAELLCRLRFAGVPDTFEQLVGRGAATARRLDDIRIEGHLTGPGRTALAHGAPVSLRVADHVNVRLEYREDGRVVAAVKIQKVFGITDTPRVGPRKVPVTFELLAPNGRPVQVTSDLASFWARGYPEVRQALRARYPKHVW